MSCTRNLANAALSIRVTLNTKPASQVLIISAHPVNTTSLTRLDKKRSSVRMAFVCRSEAGVVCTRFSSIDGRENVGARAAGPSGRVISLVMEWMSIAQPNYRA